MMRGKSGKTVLVLMPRSCNKIHTHIEITDKRIQMIHLAAQVGLHFSVSNKCRSSFSVIIPETISTWLHNEFLGFPFTTLCPGKRNLWADEGKPMWGDARWVREIWGLNWENIGLLYPQCNHLASEHLDHADELFGLIYCPLLELRGTMFTFTSTPSELHLRS